MALTCKNNMQNIRNMQWLYPVYKTCTGKFAGACCRCCRCCCCSWFCCCCCCFCCCCICSSSSSPFSAHCTTPRQLKCAAVPIASNLQRSCKIQAMLSSIKKYQKTSCWCENPVAKINSKQEDSSYLVFFKRSIQTLAFFFIRNISEPILRYLKYWFFVAVPESFKTLTLFL